MDYISIIPIAILHGLVYGMILFLLASGLTLIFGMMDVLNFSHGAFYMLGAYFSFTVLNLTGQFWLSLIIAPVLVGLAGIILEQLFLRKVHAYGHVAELLVTFGAAYILEDVVMLFWGSEPLKIQLPAILKGSIPIFGSIYPVYRLFIILVSLAVFLLLILILYKTRAGIIVRAAVDNKEMVGALGFNVPLVFLVLFGVGSWLAGLAGVIGGPLFMTHPAMGAVILIDLFVVVVVGGLGSIKGALFAAILIGILQSFGILFLPNFVLFLQFSLLAIVLVFKPEGLFGESQ